MTRSRSRMPLLALAAAAGTLAAAVALLSRPEAMIGAGFEAALTQARHTDQLGTAAGAGRLVDAQAFDPRHLRPSSLLAGPERPVLGPLKVGERVLIATAGGEQMLEVVDVHPLARSVLGAGDEGQSGGLVLVTLRADDDSGTTVRLLVEAPAEPAVPVPAVTGRRAL